MGGGRGKAGVRGRVVEGACIPDYGGEDFFFFFFFIERESWGGYAPSRLVCKGPNPFSLSNSLTSISFAFSFLNIYFQSK